MNIFFVVIRNMKLFVMMRIKVNQNFFGLWWSKSFGSFDFWREDVCVGTWGTCVISFIFVVIRGI